MSPVFFSCDAFSFFHEESSEALVLELVRVSGGNWNDAAINVEFADDGDAIPNFGSANRA